MPHSARILYVLRHAKAVPATEQPDDHARVLTEKGRHTAAMIGEYCRKHAIAPQRVLCSGAQRAKETLEEAMDAADAAWDTAFTERLYLASPNEIVAVLRELPDAVSRAMIVGHNPGLHMFCQQMAPQGDPASLEELNEHFPTCAFAEITLPAGPWKDLRFGQGYLSGVLLPKEQMMDVG